MNRSLARDPLFSALKAAGVAIGFAVLVFAVLRREFPVVATAQEPVVERVTLEGAVPIAPPTLPHVDAPALLTAPYRIGATGEVVAAPDVYEVRWRNKACLVNRAGGLYCVWLGRAERETQR